MELPFLTTEIDVVAKGGKFSGTLKREEIRD